MSTPKSKVCATAFAFPVTITRRFKAFDFQAILTGDVIILVGKLVQCLHGVVGAGVVLAVFRQLAPFQVRRLFQHGFGVDRLSDVVDLLFRKLSRFYCLADLAFLVVDLCAEGANVLCG